MFANSTSATPNYIPSINKSGHITTESSESIDAIPLWKRRTPEINHSITKAFQSVARDAKSEWGLFNGDDTYGIIGVKEHKLMRKLIQQRPGDRKDFYALDIGAGNYQWGRALAKYLNTKNDIPKDVTVHIIGVRGETNLDKAVTELGQCTLYEFGQFQIENIMDEFQKRGLHLANKVDLAVSRWCFRHLVDPVGTFAQTYDLLRPRTGHLMLDGFLFLHENEEMHDELIDFNGRMTRLCLETRASFLTRYYDSTRSMHHFAINKLDANPCPLQKQYLRAKNSGHEWQIGSGTVTQFKEAEVKTPLLYEGEYRGDKGLYERLRQNGLLVTSDLVWGPLQAQDVNQKKPALHIAIASGDEEAIYHCLQEECDFNESDDEGFTPLHLAIKHNNYKLFCWLLKKGAITKLFADGCTPLHLATQYDMDGCFVKALILARADVNIKRKGIGGSKLTPLELAIKHKNLKAIELLLEAKAFVNYQIRQQLERDLAFLSSIQHLLPKRLSELEGFDSIIKHIQEGDYVILTYPGPHFGRTFQKSSHSKEEGKLIRVSVNPETRLLDDRNYAEIEDLSKCESNFLFRDDKVETSFLELKFGF